MDGPWVYYTNEIRERKINTVWSHLMWSLKKKKEKERQGNQIRQSHSYREQNGGCQRWGKMGEGSQMVQTCS